MSGSSNPFTATREATNPHVNVRFNADQRQALNRLKTQTGDLTDSAVIKRAIGFLYQQYFENPEKGQD